ncbi:MULTISPECIES: MFS transporter [unclassified Streptomyces]|uniref:MFS transporter n=1 Tax=unclassified Streptomyces TaxID=2593676 RepID=UPI001C614A1E|nr:MULTISPECIES: MFS transporter [unclassified Streptomyces]
MPAGERGGRSSRWLWWLLACVIRTQTALNLARPLLSYKAIALGGDASAIGLITSAYALLSLVVAVPLGRLADRTTRAHWIVLGGIVLLVGAPLLLAASFSLTAVAVAGTVLGFGHIVSMIAGQGLVARRSTDSDLDRNFGWFTAAVAVGQMTGPLIGGLVLGQGQAAELGTPIVHALLLAAVIAAAGAVGLVGLVRNSPRHPTGATRPAAAERPPVFSLLRTPGVAPGLFISLALLSSVDLLTAYLPLIAEQRGISPAATGVLLALRAAFSIASRLLLATLLTRWSRRTLVVSSALGSAVSLSLVALPWADQWWLMAPALAVGGFLLGIGQPLTMTSVVLAVPTHARGTALALRLWANRLGQVALPAGAGLVAASAGAAGSLWFACGVLAAAAGTGRFTSRS